MQRPLRRGDGHLALAAHHLEPLANGLLPLPLEWPEVVDVATKGPGLGGMMQRQAGTGERLERPDGTAALHQPAPQVLEREAQRTAYALVDVVDYAGKLVRRDIG